jgi:hypothetical protein
LIATPLTVAEMVFASAVGEENVDVDTPLAFVGGPWLFEPVGPSTTVAPGTGLVN